MNKQDSFNRLKQKIPHFRGQNVHVDDCFRRHNDESGSFPGSLESSHLLQIRDITISSAYCI